MSDIVINLISMNKPISIKYTKNMYGFSGSDNCPNKYLFELTINGRFIGKKYFRNLEESKFSHLISVEDDIKLSDIESYKVSITISSFDQPITCELTGKINQSESSSTQRNNNIYIEFSKNNIGNALCSCFYIGFDHNKIFASPPN